VFGQGFQVVEPLTPQIEVLSQGIARLFEALGEFLIVSTPIG
jgi:hypothetical protein